MRPAVVTVAILMCAAAAGAFLGMRKKTPPPTGAIVVPYANEAIKIDGELDEPSWTAKPARTGAFPPGKPYSDARLLADDATLYVALYAADEDIETRTDAFRLTFDVRGTKHAIDVSPSCVVSDATIRLACDTDGTINEPNDMDEEWVVEMALSLAAMGIEHGDAFGLTIERCDTPKHEKRACTAWSHAVVVP